MIVCIVCDVLGEKNNGTTLAATNLIDHLRSKGHEVRVVCCDKDKKGKENYYEADNSQRGFQGYSWRA